MKPNTIVFSASSDIGHELCSHWLNKGHNIYGTFRTDTNKVRELKDRGATLVQCDLSDSGSYTKAIRDLKQICKVWDNLVLCPGTQEPVGRFCDVDFDKWAESINLNFTAQLRCIHSLMPSRRKDAGLEPLVLMFAGGGTNNATVNYSAYTIAKLALIKVCELLDAEESDTRFVILGPGWVHTKIHQSTIDAGPRFAGSNYYKTIDKLSGNACNPVSRVVECCDWVIASKREVVGGRNFSVVFDSWSDPRLDEELVRDRDMYKLRRFRNDFKT